MDTASNSSAGSHAAFPGQNNSSGPNNNTGQNRLRTSTDKDLFRGQTDAASIAARQSLLHAHTSHTKLSSDKNNDNTNDRFDRDQNREKSAPVQRYGSDADAHKYDHGRGQMDRDQYRGSDSDIDVDALSMNLNATQYSVGDDDNNSAWGYSAHGQTYSAHNHAHSSGDFDPYSLLEQSSYSPAARDRLPAGVGRARAHYDSHNKTPHVYSLYTQNSIHGKNGFKSDMARAPIAAVSNARDASSISRENSAEYLAKNGVENLMYIKYRSSDGSNSSRQKYKSRPNSFSRQKAASRQPDSRQSDFLREKDKLAGSSSVNEGW